MKMIQTLYPSSQEWVEVFYDGELKVENNMVDIPQGREHWRNILLIERGFDDYAEPSVKQEVQSPKKKVKDTPHD